MKKILSMLIPASLAVFVMTFIAAIGPELHRGFIRNKVGSKTVKLMGEKSGGSGFFVKAESGDTYIVSNAHVCEGAKIGSFIRVHTKTHGVFISNILEIYEKHDLCIIEGIKGIEGLDVAEFIYTGQTMGAIGHPKLQPLTISLGEYIGHTNITIADGINLKDEDCKGKNVKAPFFMHFMGISKVCLIRRYSMQLTSYARPGSSGSPVVNFYGNVTGVIFAVDTKDQFRSYAVPLNVLKEFLKNY